MTRGVYAQYIKIDNGIVFSSFNNKKSLPLLTSRINNYSFLFGTDFLEKKWFYLSSQVGYTKLGGQETNLTLPSEFRNISESRNYVHVNITPRFYVNSNGLKMFIGIGPYANILIGGSDFDNVLYKYIYRFERSSVGSKLDLGVTHDVDKFRIGLVGTYMHSLSPLAKSDYLPFSSSAFSLMISAGYKIK